MANATEDLKTILANGQALIICGAGVSAALTGNKAPGWGQLIKNALEYAKLHAAEPAWMRSCRELLAHDATTEDWLDSATKIKRELGAKFYAFLDHQLKPLVCQDKQFVDALASMVAAGNVLATTNYDDLLWKGLGTRPVTWRNSESAMNVVTGQSEGILHLHGHWEDVASVIFSGEDYEGIRSSEAAQFMQQLSTHQRTLVFVGCSQSGLGDENIGEMLEWFQTHWSGLGKKHFVLHLKSDDAGWPPAVTPISFGENHGDLTGFLKSIAPPPKENKPRLEVRPNMQGRKADLQQVVNWVLADRQPIIIPGQPGMGKSALALELAYHADVQAKFGDERYFLRLDAATDADAMMNAVALRLNMHAQGNAENIADAVAKTCVKPTLLILDNLETPWHNNSELVEAAIARLAAGDQLNLVLTIRGDTPNLSCDAHQSDEIAALQADDAKALFLRGTRDKLSDDPDLDKLINVLDGHPLSIILMAAQADAEPAVANLLQRWKAEKAKMLTKGGADHRLNNLMISVNLSFKKLSPEGKRLARLVARLPAGLALWMAQDVLGELLANAASLELAKARLAINTANRLTMLAPLRAAIIELPVQIQADEDALRTKLIDIAARGDHVFVKLLAHEQEELENLDSAVNWAIAENEETGLNGAVKGLSTLHRFTGRASISSIYAATQFWKAKKNSRYLASTLLGLGLIALSRSNHEEARAKFEEALPLYKNVDEVLGQANCIHRLGDIALRRSKHEEARAKFEEALPLYNSVGDVLGQANNIMSLGDIALHRSNHEEARAKFEEALPLYKSMGDVLGQANCIMRLGDIALRRSNHDEARAKFEEALPLYKSFGAVLGQANCIQGLGDIALEHSNHDEARAKFEEALELYSRIPEPYSMGHAHRRLAGLTKGTEKSHHRAEARRLWLLIDRADLVAEY
jgi:tetratricopeptide (TPR) repeat protein